MSWQRLNHLMLLHANKGAPTALIDLVDVANDYIARNDHIKHIFLAPSSRSLINCELLYVH